MRTLGKSMHTSNMKSSPSFRIGSAPRFVDTVIRGRARHLPSQNEAASYAGRLPNKAAQSWIKSAVTASGRADRATRPPSGLEEEEGPSLPIVACAASLPKVDKRSPTARPSQLRCRRLRLVANTSLHGGPRDVPGLGQPHAKFCCSRRLRRRGPGPTRVKKACARLVKRPGDRLSEQLHGSSLVQSCGVNSDCILYIV